jgi:hypothetical protein
VDDEFCDTEKSEEEQCLCLWVWTPDLEGSPISAILHVVEPVTLPHDGYAEILMELGMPVGAMRIDQAKVLDYEVLVHVDCVLDYAPRGGPTWYSMVFIEYQSFLKKMDIYIYIVYASCVFN